MSLERPQLVVRVIAIVLALWFAPHVSRESKELIHHLEKLPPNVTCFRTTSVRPTRNRSTWLAHVDPSIVSISPEDGPLACAPFLHVVISAAFNRQDVPQARQDEYKATLLTTLKYPFVKHVHLIWDVEPDTRFLEALPAHLLRKVVHDGKAQGRIGFLKAFRYINANVPAGEVVLVPNSDIVIRGGFDCGSLDKDKLPLNTVLVPQRQEADCHYDGTPKESTCDCRQEVLRDSSRTRMLNCFDSYIVRSPLPPALLTETRLGSSGPLGLWMGGQNGCDNAIVAELRAVGINVIAPPCGQFKLVHEHCSQSRPNQIGPGAENPKLLGSKLKINKARYSSRLADSAEPACYATLCTQVCEVPYLHREHNKAHADAFTRLCRNISNCHNLWESKWPSHFGGIAKLCGAGSARKAVPQCAFSGHVLSPLSHWVKSIMRPRWVESEPQGLVDH